MRRTYGEGSVFFSKSKNCWIWKAVVGKDANGKFRYKTGRAPSRPEAIARKRRAEARQEQAGSNKLVNELIDEWLEIHKLQVRDTTHLKNVECLNRVKLAMQGIRVKSLTGQKIEEMLNNMRKKGLMPNTIRMTYSAFSQVLKRFQLHHLLKNVVKLRDHTAKTIQVFTVEEVETLVAHTRHPYRMIVLLASTTGMRIGEILALDWDDITENNRYITVSKSFSQKTVATGPPKTRNSYRTIEVPAFVAAELAGYRSIYQAFSKHVFTTNTGRRISHTIIYLYMKRVYQLTSVPRRNFHVFRHTHASQLMQSGVSLSEIARRLGDTISTVVKTYSHWIRPEKNTADIVSELYKNISKSATFAPPSQKTPCDI